MAWNSMQTFDFNIKKCNSWKKDGISQVTTPV